VSFFDDQKPPAALLIQALKDVTFSAFIQLK
jgi:hypothetical protein